MDYYGTYKLTVEDKEEIKDFFEDRFQSITDCDMEEVLKEELPHIQKGLSADKDEIKNMICDMVIIQGLKDGDSKSLPCTHAVTLLKHHTRKHVKMLEYLLFDTTPEGKGFDVNSLIRSEFKKLMRQKVFYESLAGMFGHLLIGSHKRELERGLEEDEKWKQEPTIDQKLFDLFNKRFSN